MNPSQACYDNVSLQRLLNDQLDERDESSVMHHIDGCDHCQRSLENIAANKGTWNELKIGLADQFFPDLADETISMVERDRDLEMERLQEYLGPTDDPDMLGRLGSYEVCGLVGRGSTGVVVKALEPRLNRYVAIKVLSPSFSSNGPARTRFEREGRAVAAVANAHVVPVFAVDEYRGLPFIVMQYVPGGSLLQRIENHGPLETIEVVRMGMQIARGLAAAHEQGIVHRDVKPANVMLENKVDRAMVGDFGLARVADEAAMTRSGVIAGTPQYMSPEQAKGDAIDQRSDLFSLGSVLYHACTGKAPFRAETVFGVIQRVCTNAPTPIREINPDIDAWLEGFIARLHAKNRDDRFASSAEVAEILSRELAYLQGPAYMPAPERPWFTSRSKTGASLVKIGAVVAAVAATFAAVVAMWGPGDSGDPVAWNPLAENRSDLTTTVDNTNSSSNEYLFPNPGVARTFVLRRYALNGNFLNSLLDSMNSRIRMDMEESRRHSLSIGRNQGFAEISNPEERIRSVDVACQGQLDEACHGESDEHAHIASSRELFQPDSSLVFMTPDVTAIERTTRHVFPSVEGRAIIVTADVSSLIVESADCNDIEVIITKRIAADFREWADEIAEMQEISFEVGADHLKVLARLRESVLDDPRFEGDKPFPFQGSILRFRTPRHQNWNLTTDVGTINVSEMDGDVFANTCRGAIRLVNLMGQVDATTSSGSFDIQGCAAIKAVTDSGCIQARFERQPLADCLLETRLGTVMVELSPQINLNVRSKTDSGSVSGIVGWRNRNFTLGSGGPGLLVDSGTGHIGYFMITEPTASSQDHHVDTHPVTRTYPSWNSGSH